MTKQSLSVVIPVYNSRATLPEMVRRLEQELPRLERSFELVVVDDGSSDGSWQMLQQLAAERKWIRGVGLARNAGQHAAVLCGIRSAANDLVVTMDDDLQYPPDQIASLLAKLEEGHDVVYGTPARQRHQLWRVLASKLTKRVLQRTMGAETARMISPFRAFRRWVSEAFARYDNPYVNIDVLLSWGTSRFAAVEVRHEERTEGGSNYTFSKLITHAVNMLTGFTTVPLRLASLVGFAFTAFGAVVLVYVLVRYVMEGGVVPGFPFLASIIAIFAGAQLFSLGILGEYLARMYYRSMQRPSYVVRETLAHHQVGSTPVDGGGS